jgi:SAM-dependent methyltransferase
MTASLTDILHGIFQDQSLIQAVFSAPTNKGAKSPTRVTIRPLAHHASYQVSEQIGTQAFHRNMTSTDCQALILKELAANFRQAALFTTTQDWHLTLLPDKVKVKKKAASKQATETITHNRQKEYLIEQSQPISYLVALGIMNAQGRIYTQKMAKYRQINRFLEMVADILPHLDRARPMHVIDFGCGKAYLTFALYDYLKRVCGYDVRMVGLDLKETVIQACQQLAEELGFEGLRFQLGDIAAYAPQDAVDLVVALHACDTATDAALAIAVRWQAKVILAAPCCQHELNGQVRCAALDAVLHYGLLRERFAALATDAVRACLLEAAGYQTQILEFIDSAHTPKNLLIRAVKGNTAKQREQAAQRYAAVKGALHIQPKLDALLG